ncbi:secretin receptor-like [Gigantopelta aegis]|uniref:secretin receptor-like n=1 Tax=Gigantopelta aegis TaxID=1735272 RepID=UPI001B88D34F|nr:secretin receptor-like [Gigantopelta aegis]
MTTYPPLGLPAYGVLAITSLLTTLRADVVWISPEDQQQRIQNASIACYKQMYNESRQIPNGVHCPMYWDTLVCWPDTPAGTVSVMPCPNYVNMFQMDENASKVCTENGTWFVSPTLNKMWTNYSSCMAIFNKVPPLIAANIDRIRLMANIGYGMSLVSLILAIIIMLSFKRLHCARNTIHLNLFVSFILRATFSFLKENILVQGLGFPVDVRQHKGGVEFIEGTEHWECKLFFALYNYTLAANYMWIFVEALYLHMLILVAMFSEKSGIRWYIIFGWASPITFVVPWAIVRLMLEDKLCWNTHPTQAYFWIMQGPIVLSTLVNFGFFLNVIRILFTKLNAAHSPEAKKFRYRRLAKSILVLIPLFGVHYIVFLGLPDKHVNETAQLVKLYFEMFFNSIQGFFVSLLFCFFNGEVQGEIRKQWYRFRLMRATNFRNSRNLGNHTFSSYVSHESHESPKLRRSSAGATETIAMNGITSCKNPNGPLLDNTCTADDDCDANTSLTNGHL